ncbi:hypothetical protein ACJMK2_020383 [Sinanodonta woodiana]|uniref:Fibrinogen C-terminal domain-containing protein n=1 Tax=Sinanodonta woodiana TaxID=1069815 RepID=A0ABD3TZ91_SINWO
MDTHGKHPMYLNSGCGLSPSSNWSIKSTHEEIIGTRVKYRCPNGMSQRGNPIIQCQANGTWTDFNFTCAPRNCKEIRDQVQAVTGIYLIFPSSDSAGITVRCDMTTDGGGWTVFQRRIDGSTDFYRGWGDYKRGFGDMHTEFWLGLDIINVLTSQEAVKLRVDLVPPGSPAIPAYAKYATFRVGDENSKYVLTVGNYSGDAGNSLRFHNGMAFSSNDRDNDLSPNNCAFVYHGAWWYNFCHNSNLNGEYGSTVYGRGVVWSHLSGYNVSMVFTEMKIRGL